MSSGWMNHGIYLDLFYTEYLEWVYEYIMEVETYGQYPHGREDCRETMSYI